MLFGMSDVTRILSQIEQGDSQAAEKLLPLVYEELRKLAAAKLAMEKPGQTLVATALVSRKAEVPVLRTSGRYRLVQSYPNLMVGAISCRTSGPAGRHAAPGEAVTAS
jgi:hypothetical protein